MIRVLVLLLAIASCSKPSELARRVEFRCGDLRGELVSRERDLASLAPGSFLDRLKFSIEARVTDANWFQTQSYFCISVRETPSWLENTLQMLTVMWTRQYASPYADRASILAAATALRGLVEDVRQIPLRD